MKRGKSSGTFTRAKRSSAVFGSRTSTPSAERERGDVRERLARADGERGEHRVDLALEERRELLELLVRAVRDPPDHDSFRLERGPRSRFQSFACRRSRPRPARGSPRALARARARRASGPRGPSAPGPWRPLTRTAKNSSRCEEKREQNLSRSRSGSEVGGELEDAVVEVEPGELAVEEALGSMRNRFLSLPRSPLARPAP